MSRIWNTKEMDESTQYPDEFEGIVDAVEWEDSPYGERLVLYVVPTNYEGPTRTWRYKYSEKRNSIWGNFIEALEKTGIVISSEQDLVNKKIAWKIEEISFGINRDGDEMTARMLTPVKYLGEETRDNRTWTNKEIELVLKSLKEDTKIPDLMKNLNIPAELKKSIILVATDLSSKGVISFNPMNLEIGPQ